MWKQKPQNIDVATRLWSPEWFWSAAFFHRSMCPGCRRLVERIVAAALSRDSFPRSSLLLSSVKRWWTGHGMSGWMRSWNLGRGGRRSPTSGLIGQAAHIGPIPRKIELAVTERGAQGSNLNWWIDWVQIDRNSQSEPFIICNSRICRVRLSKLRSKEYPGVSCQETSTPDPLLWAERSKNSSMISKHSGGTHWQSTATKVQSLIRIKLEHLGKLRRKLWHRIQWSAAEQMTAWLSVFLHTARFPTHVRCSTAVAVFTRLRSKLFMIFIFTKQKQTRIGRRKPTHLPDVSTGSEYAIKNTNTWNTCRRHSY